MWEKAEEYLIKNYVNFSGRASRSEYWKFILILIIVTIILTLIDVFTGTYNEKSGRGLLSNMFYFIIFIPNLAVQVRRLHDVNKSGWWILIIMILLIVPSLFDVNNSRWWFIVVIPIIGYIWLLVQFCIKGTEGDNRFGSDPLQQ